MIQNGRPNVKACKAENCCRKLRDYFVLEIINVHHPKSNFWSTTEANFQSLLGKLCSHYILAISLQPDNSMRIMMGFQFPWFGHPLIHQALKSGGYCFQVSFQKMQWFLRNIFITDSVAVPTPPQILILAWVEFVPTPPSNFDSRLGGVCHRRASISPPVFL